MYEWQFFGVLDRDIQGEGQMVGIGPLYCEVFLMENQIARYFAAGINSSRIRNQHPYLNP